MLLERFSKKFLKSTAIFFGSIIILLTAFHFWFVAHAEELIQNLVATKSRGTLKLEVGNFSFNWLSKKMELKDAVFYTTDTGTAATSYRFAVKKIKLKVREILPMIFEKRVMINLINLKDPDIIVTRLRTINKEKDSTDSDEDFSIPREMGRIYNSIQDALDVLKVKKFEIENAQVTLSNRVKPNQVPIVISKIDFHIDNLKVDSAQYDQNQKIFFSDNIVFKSRDQDILFPNGRHRLSFRKFRINIEKKIVEFDSCTIAAIKTDSSSAAFSIYFDALMLTNIDFDTLYRAEVIKADSVYCTNPRFKLDVDLDAGTGKRKAPPKLDEIIQQLTGDLELNFVVVHNASFDVNTKKNNKVSSFSSQKNNFEIQGLRVDKEAERALKVEKFAMAIRNYENFLRDSTYEIQFDSVIFNNNQIFLSSFSFRQLEKGRVVKSFIVPRFHLTGLSWDDLLFEQKFRAQGATLYSPVIKYTATGKGKKRRSRSIYEAIAAINDVMMLDNLNIIKGNIDMQLNGTIRMKLENATLSVESKTFLGSNQLSQIRRSVNHLDFNKGFFRINDLTVILNDIKYTGPDSRLNAGTAVAFNNSKTINATAAGVTMDEIFINEQNEDVNINGVTWKQAEIRIAGTPGKKKGSGTSTMNMKNILGQNTGFRHSSGDRSISAFIDQISATEIMFDPGQKPRITGLNVSGKALKAGQGGSALGIATFDLADLSHANFRNIKFTKTQAGNITDISIPQLSFTPNIHSVIAGDIIANDITIDKPVINIHADRKDSGAVKKNIDLPRIRTNQLLIQQPEVHFTQNTAEGQISLEWKGSRDKNSLLFTDAGTEKSLLFTKQLVLSLNNFLFTNASGKTFDAGKGEVHARVNDISFNNTDGIPEWKATVSLLDAGNFRIDSLGKQSGVLDIKTIQLRDLALNSAYTSLRQVIKRNTRFRLAQITGGYANAANKFKWFNGAYDRGSRTFTLDSFNYRPVLDKDSFVLTHPYQTDYIHASTGEIRIGPFDIDRYLSDTIVSIGRMEINDPVFTDHRDNRSPFKTGIHKPLMTDRIKSIPFKLSIDSIVVNNGHATYTEVNPKTGLAGVIPVTRMTVRLFPIRNFDLDDTDSIRIQANGYIMDSIWIRIRLRESYMDTLAGFLFTLRMKPSDMMILNPVLGPLASVKLKSGYLDTLSMRVAGHEYFAYGEMEMMYHDLKVQILANGSPHQKKLFTALMNFVANTFIIKNKNASRTGNVYFLRNRERSALNYLIKIALSGMTTSVGAKSNRKVLRKYKKELRQRDLPPVDFE